MASRDKSECKPPSVDFAELFAGHGEPEGEAVWRRIAAAVKELQRQEPRESESVN